MITRQRIIAVCSCHAQFYDHETSIDRMNLHINGDNYLVHRWLLVADLDSSDILKDTHLRRVVCE